MGILNRKSWILFAILMLAYTTAFPQNKKKVREPPKIYSVVSDDGRYYAINYSLKRFKDGELTFVNSCKVYHIRSRKYISKVNFYLPTHPEYFIFSPDSKKLYTKSKSNFYLIDIKSRRPQKKFDRTYALGFIAGGKQVVIAKKDSILTYDSNTLKELPSFRFLGKPSPILQLKETPDQKYLIGIGQPKSYIWDIKTRKLLKTLDAVTIQQSPDRTKFYVINYRSRLCYFDIYDVATLKRIRATNSNSYKHFSTYSFTEASSISPDGKYFTFCAKQYGETKGLGVFEIESGKQVLDIDSIALEDNFAELEQPYHWFNNSAIYVQTKSDNQCKIFDTDSSTSTLAFHHKFKEKRISPNGEFICSFSSHKSSNLITVGLNSQKHAPIYIDGVKFLSYSPNSKFLFVEKKDRSHGFILTKDIAPGKTPKVYSFSTTPFLPSTEDEITEDSQAPEDYKHTYIHQFKHISELKDTTSLSIHYKSTIINGDTIGVQAHLIDEQGTYYYGASAEDFRKYWCGISVSTSADTIPNSFPAFSITESNIQDTIPLAIAFIMDHSGSMGDERALVVQEAVANLIGDKRPQDTIAILKYDSKVGIESNLASQKEILLGRLQKNGIGHFGGGTALIDAANEGIELLKQAENFQHKAIVIFTDGKENSSVLTKNELILEALLNDVKIYTIAFGSEVDQGFLKDIAEATDGGYYQIYETLDFLKIFKDVYQRVHNYYTIQFKADTVGKQLAKIKLCLPQKTDSLSFEFSNDTLYTDFEEIVIEEIPEDKYSDFDKTPKKGDIKLLDIKFQFATTTITDESTNEIQKAIDYLNQYPDIIVELRGHTDSIGHEHANLKLSKHRAQKVKHLLVQSGIKAHRIKTSGFGEDAPIASNHTPEGRALNRRTEFVIISE